MNRTRGNPYVQPYGYLINWFSKLRLEDEKQRLRGISIVNRDQA